MTVLMTILIMNIILMPRSDVLHFLVVVPGKGNVSACGVALPKRATAAPCDVTCVRCRAWLTRIDVLLLKRRSALSRLADK